ncbi:MAG: enoyl-CoA hydratase/isomerase family protein [Gammaproteobacteria bacterium]|nr:enoyl-CoA hydratase/isomerase family protein [Gammaproteobacteria bacterium]
MASPHVRLEVDARGVATVTLDRPDKHNAFNEDVIAGLTAVFNAVANDPSARALVLRANGASFCAGADIEWMKRMAGFNRKENLTDAANLADMLETLYFLPVPTIARVQGAALGGGAGLVCCCDMAVAAGDAQFAFSEVRLGLVPATISPYVIRAIGVRAARRYCLTAERFDAKRALTLGLVNEMAPDDALDDCVTRLVDAILLNGPEAVRSTKRLLLDVAERELDEELLRNTIEWIAEIRTTDEAREGLAAFLERRAPDWNRHGKS